MPMTKKKNQPGGHLNYHLQQLLRVEGTIPERTSLLPRLRVSLKVLARLHHLPGLPRLMKMTISEHKKLHPGRRGENAERLKSEKRGVMTYGGCSIRSVIQKVVTFLVALLLPRCTLSFQLNLLAIRIFFAIPFQCCIEMVSVLACALFFAWWYVVRHWLY